MTLHKASSAVFASALILGLSFGIPVKAAEQTSPQEAVRFVERLGNKAVTILSSGNAGVPAKRRAALRELIRGGFDLELTSQLVRGKTWGQASPEQRAEFQELFTEYFLSSYTRHLGAYRAETLTIVASHPVGGGDVLVETSIEHDDEATKAVWRVRPQHDGEYKIIDVVFDGISLALTIRREFASVIKHRGLDGLLKLLRKKVADRGGATFARRRAVSGWLTSAGNGQSANTGLKPLPDLRVKLTAPPPPSGQAPVAVPWSLADIAGRGLRLRPTARLGAGA